MRTDLRFDPAFWGTPKMPLPRLAPLVIRFSEHLLTYRAPLTQRGYVSALCAVFGVIERELGRPPELEDLSRKALQRAIERAPKGSVHTWMVALRSFFKYLTVIEELEIRNPALGLLQPYRPAPAPTRLLSVDEALHLLDAPLRAGDRAIHVRDATTLLLLYGFGLRTAEAARLDLHQVDLDAPEPGYCQVAVLGKGNRWGQVPGPRAVRDRLARYLERRPELVRDPGERAFLLQAPNPMGTGGQRMSDRAVYQAVRRYVPKEVRLYPHLFRHALCSHLIAAGADVAQVRDVMRHRNLVTTNSYAHTRSLLAAVDRHPLARRGRDKPDGDP